MQPEVFFVELRAFRTLLEAIEKIQLRIAASSREIPDRSSCQPSLFTPSISSPALMEPCVPCRPSVSTLRSVLWRRRTGSPDNKTHRQAKNCTILCWQGVNRGFYATLGHLKISKLVIPLGGDGFESHSLRHTFQQLASAAITLQSLALLSSLYRAQFSWALSLD